MQKILGALVAEAWFQMKRRGRGGKEGKGSEG